MKIRMTKTAPGSVDGIRVQQYEAGVEYDLSASAGERDLAVAFVGAGFADPVDGKPQPVAVPEAAEMEVAPVAEPSAPASAKPGRKPKNT
jgi:hypothetical protein